MSTKDTLRQLTRLFSTSPSSATPVQQSFPGYALPHEVDELLNEHLRAFASAFPLTNAGGSGSGQSEGERERIRWREGLLEIWATAEPLPGAERELHNIGRVSAFLLLLHKLSADVGNDDDSALISRKDIGSVWWNAILRRTMLGTPKEAHAAALGAKPSQTRGRKTERDRKGKEPAPPSSADALPLYVSRQALAAATRMIVWGMEPSREQADKEEDWVSPFGLAILNEYEDRSLAKLKGLDEGYGIRNLEECLIEWAERAPKVRLRIRLVTRCSSQSTLVLAGLLHPHLTLPGTEWAGRPPFRLPHPLVSDPQLDKSLPRALHSSHREPYHCRPHNYMLRDRQPRFKVPRHLRRDAAGHHRRAPVRHHGSVRTASVVGDGAGRR